LRTSWCFYFCRCTLLIPVYALPWALWILGYVLKKRTRERKRDREDKGERRRKKYLSVLLLLLLYFTYYGLHTCLEGREEKGKGEKGSRERWIEEKGGQGGEKEKRGERTEDLIVLLLLSLNLMHFLGFP
jgi:hypothetical protein